MSPESRTGSGDLLRSPVRRPQVGVNPGAGSIHDDATAQALGFRGGTIAGSLHMDQFPELLVETFGRRWFETGSLSLSFKHATTSGEPVVAMVARPSGEQHEQVEARLEQPDGTLVGEGTAAVGQPSSPTHLSSVDLRPSPPSALRILAGVGPGSPLSHQARIDAVAVAERVRRGLVPDPFGWHAGSSPWGGPIANPSSLVQLLRNRGHEFGPHIAGAVGLFGAIEIRHLGGPVMLDAEYRVSGEVVAVGASPRTEYVWYDTAARDQAGTVVATMRMQLRWMTESSPLYSQRRDH